MFTINSLIARDYNINQGVVMVEKFWLVEFSSSVGMIGKGVAVMENGKIFAGDSGYYYIGFYNIENDRLNAQVKITRHNPQHISVFGNLETAEISFKNQTVNGGLDGQTIKGALIDNPAMQIAVKFTKISELN